MVTQKSEKFKIRYIEKMYDGLGLIQPFRTLLKQDLSSYVVQLSNIIMTELNILPFDHPDVKETRSALRKKMIMHLSSVWHSYIIFRFLPRFSRCQCVVNLSFCSTHLYRKSFFFNPMNQQMLIFNFT